MRDLRDFGEVDCSSLGEHDAELGCGVAEQRETGADNLPFIFGVAGGGQFHNAGECGFETGDGVEAGYQVEDFVLLAFAVGGEAVANVDLFAECGAAGEQQFCEAEVCVSRFFKSVRRELGARKFSELGQLKVKLVAGLCAGEARQFQRLLAGSGNLIEELIEGGQRRADNVGERAFKALAEPVLIWVFVIRFALEQKGVHPAIALGEHFNELIFQLLPVVVAPQEQCFDGCVQGRIGPTDLLQGMAGGAAIEIDGMVGNVEAAAQAGE